MSAGRMILGGMIAFGTGVVLGVLFAPEKGSVTRKKLAKQGTRNLDALEKAAGGYVDAIEEKFESAKEAAAGITDKVMDAVDTLAGNEPRKRARQA